MLANYPIFHQNVKGYHWKIQGDKFFELHSTFEELYNDLYAVAERILTLGFSPNYKFSTYLQTALIPESNDVTYGYNSIKEIPRSLQIFLSKHRVLLHRLVEINDAGTNDLINGYTSE